MTDIKVLWVDDRPFPEIEKRSAKYGISLRRVADSDEGKELLNKNLDQWDFVLLDGRGTKKGEVENTRGAKDMLRELTRLEMVRKIPCCIFSAYAAETDLVALKEFYEDDLEVFSKIETEDPLHPYHKLFEYIISEAGKLASRQVQNRYSQVFEAAEEIGLSTEYINNLVRFLKSAMIEKYRDDHPGQNELRQIIEGTCKILHNAGVIPDECFRRASGCLSTDIVIDDAIKYLCGQRTANIFGQSHPLGVFHDGGPVIPSFMTGMLKAVLLYTQDGSHDKTEITDSDRVDRNAVLTDYMNAIPNSCFMYSAVFIICDLIIFAAKYIREHSQPEVNRAECIQLYECCEKDKNGNPTSICVIEGTYPEIHCGRYIKFGQPKSNGHSASVYLTEGMKIKIKTANPNSFNDGYLLFCNNFDVCK